jgi:hypothetical protein
MSLSPGETRPKTLQHTGSNCWLFLQLRAQIRSVILPSSIPRPLSFPSLPQRNGTAYNNTLGLCHYSLGPLVLSVSCSEFNILIRVTAHSVSPSHHLTQARPCWFFKKYAYTLHVDLPLFRNTEGSGIWFKYRLGHQASRRSPSVCFFSTSRPMPGLPAVGD